MSSGRPCARHQATASIDRGRASVPCAASGRHGGKHLMRRPPGPSEERTHCLARRTKCPSSQSRVRVGTMFRQLSERHSALQQRDYRVVEIHRCRTEKNLNRTINIHETKIK